MKSTMYLLIGFVVCLLMGASTAEYFQPRFNEIVRSKDGFLLVVDVSTAKARYVQVDTTRGGPIGSNCVEVKESGWSANHQPQPQMQ